MMVNLDLLIKLMMSLGTGSLDQIPVAKQVRTPKFKSQVIVSKKIYNRKKNDNG